VKRLFIALCLLSLLAPVAAHLDATKWRPESYLGYEDHLQVGIPALALAMVGTLGLVGMGLHRLVHSYGRRRHHDT
jgi:hypothetical protein